MVGVNDTVQYENGNDSTNCYKIIRKYITIGQMTAGTCMQECPDEKSATISWWRHRMEAFFGLLTLCAGNSPVIGEFPSQRASDTDFDVGPHNLLNKQSNDRWF